MVSANLSSRHKECLFLTFAFLVSFLSYTWRNDFPYFYHSDEESKALQLLYGYRNFWHPMLTLNVTDAISRLLQVDRDPQSLTIVGRTLAALFSSTGLVCMIAFAFRRKGFSAGVITGALLFTCPLIFEVSHYCKEDPALFMGLALSLLAWNSFSANPDARHAIYLGLSAGLAISAKYPGLFLVPLLTAAIFVRFRKPALVPFFLLAAATTTLAINWQWAFHTSELLAGLHRENRMLASGHDGVAGALPHSRYFQILRYEHGWSLILTSILGIVLPLFKNRRITLETVLAGLALIALLGLSYVAKVSDRYLLPVMVILLYQAALSISAMSSWIAARYRPLVCGLLLAAVSWHQVELFTAFVRGFQTDSRAELAAWIDTHLPPDARVATSLWTRLPGRYRGEYSSNETPPDYAADHGILQDLKAAGYGWVVVADVEDQRFTENEQMGKRERQETFERRRAFYQDLKKDHPCVWRKPTGLLYVLHPGLSLYRLEK